MTLDLDAIVERAKKHQAGGVGEAGSMRRDLCVSAIDVLALVEEVRLLRAVAEASQRAIDEYATGLPAGEIEKALAALSREPAEEAK